MAKVNPQLTRVVFRVWRDKAGGVLALFPDLPYDSNSTDIMSYEHVGQHGGASYRYCVMHTRPARPSEYAGLKAELESLGYRLQVAKRA